MWSIGSLLKDVNRCYAGKKTCVGVCLVRSSQIKMGKKCWVKNFSSKLNFEHLYSDVHCASLRGERKFVAVFLKPI